MLGINRQALTKCRRALRRVRIAMRIKRTDSKSDDSATTRGFALLIVMIVVLALSLMFGAILRATRQSADEASERVVRLKLTAALEGALLSTAYDLSQAGQQLQLGTTQTIPIGGYTAHVTIRPEFSKLDLNAADAESLQKLLEASQIPTDRAATLSKSIVAWRNGSYGGTGVQPSTGRSKPSRSFETVADLSLVGNVGQDLTSCLRPDVTVFTRSPSVDASFASERLRRAIYGNTDQPQQPISYDSVVGGAASRPDLYEISLVAEDNDRHIAVRRLVIIRVNGDDRRPLWILDDATPGPSETDASAACQRLAHHAP